MAYKGNGVAMHIISQPPGTAFKRRPPCAWCLMGLT